MKDIPKGHTKCSSYDEGHNVHYIPAMKLSRQRPATPARIVNDGTRIKLTFESSEIEVFNHTPEQLVAFADSFAGLCWWYPTLSLIAFQEQEKRNWFSISTSPITDCLRVSPQLIAEYERSLLGP